MVGISVVSPVVGAAVGMRDLVGVFVVGVFVVGE
jgi:hypothetical protein